MALRGGRRKGWAIIDGAMQIASSMVSRSVVERCEEGVAQRAASVVGRLG
jgi:hypothetical protein